MLVAAAVDYTLVPGKRHGDIAKRIAEEVRIRRREDLGLDEDAPVTKALPTYKSIPKRRQQELEGGIVIVGRPTFKEYMTGLKRGWTDGLDKVDRDEELARVLELDNHFDEPEEPDNFNDGDAPSSQSTFPSAQNSPVFSPIQMRSPTSPQPSSPAISSSSTMNQPPAIIPQHPPILFVPFLNYIGFKQIPLMMWDFFNQRHKVRSGAEAGYRLVMSCTEPLQVPETTELQPEVDVPEPESATPKPRGALDFDKYVEGYYGKWMLSLPEDTEKTRQKYYEGLQKKLATARELARGTREPTKEEVENPPPTEVELRAERLKKERRWRDDVEGWDIIKPTSDVAWDERFRGALQVFVDPLESHEESEKSLS